MREYIGGAQQVSNFDLELELVFVIVEEFSVHAYEIIQEGFIRQVGLALMVEIGVYNSHDLVTVLVIVAA